MHFLIFFLISSFGKEISFTVMSDPGAQRFSQSAAQILIIAHSLEFSSVTPDRGVVKSVDHAQLSHTTSFQVTQRHLTPPHPSHCHGE